MNEAEVWNISRGNRRKLLFIKLDYLERTHRGSWLKRVEEKLCIWKGIFLEISGKGLDPRIRRKEMVTKNIRIEAARKTKERRTEMKSE